VTVPASPDKLYSSYVFDGNETALHFWGPIPLNVQNAIAMSKPISNRYKTKKQPLFTEQRLVKLCKAIRETHQRQGMLSSMVKERLELLQTQTIAVEAGHQPALLGGPGLVINKLATIAQLAMFQDSASVMFVGDHDHEQKELTVTHLPSPGPRGLSFSYTVPREFRLSPMHILPIPSRDWLKKTLTKIASTYHELVAKARTEEKTEFEERVQMVTGIIQEAYDNATTMSEWSLRIWMKITNLAQDSGILFQQFSHSTIRQLMLPAFEHLVSSQTRLRFIEALNQAAEQLQALGYQPGIGIRQRDYVPFHLECPTTGCNRTRLDPKLIEDTRRIEISADCPKCKTTHTLEVQPNSPDLSDWAEFLSPRVDTRAFLVHSYTPVVLHIGGAGETSYHAQVSPSLHALGSVVPIFFRYTRQYYINPWTLRQAQKLQQEDISSLDLNELNRFAKAIATAIAEENSGVVRSLYGASTERILNTVEQLVQTEQQLEQERNEAIKKQRESSDVSIREQQRAIVGRQTRRRQILQTYLSQMYGRYSPERLGQEVSFAWIDGAVSLGPRTYFPRLLNHYQPYTPPSITFLLTTTPEA
jgi:uncharacterized protein YllA (UPF0747 family)